MWVALFFKINITQYKTRASIDVENDSQNGKDE